MKRAYFALVIAALFSLLGCDNENVYTIVTPVSHFQCTIQSHNLVKIQDMSIGDDVYYTFGDGSGTQHCKPNELFYHQYAIAGTYTIEAKVYANDRKDSDISKITIDVE